MAKGGAKSQRLTCPACGTVAAYKLGVPAACKVCGTAIPDPDALAPVMVTPAAPLPPSTVPQAPRGEPPTALAVVALVSGILSLVTLWVLPACLVLAAAAIVCGIIALGRHEDDPGVQAMSGIGIGLAVLGLVLMWWAFTFIDEGSGSSVYVDSSGDDDSGSSSSNDGGGSGGDGGSSGDGGGGSGDSGGDTGGSSGDAGGDTGGSGGASTDSGGLDTGVDTGDTTAPAPVAVMVGLGLLGAAAWRRRA